MPAATGSHALAPNQASLNPHDLIAMLIPGMRAAAEAIGLQEVGEIQTRLSVPVERMPDGTVIRSAPGDSPRTEEGHLLMGVDSNVENGPSGLPELTISITRSPGPGDQADAARILDEGGYNQQGRYVAPRPMAHPAAERIKEYAPTVVSEQISRLAK